MISKKLVRQVFKRKKRFAEHSSNVPIVSTYLSGHNVPFYFAKNEMEQYRWHPTQPNSIVHSSFSLNQPVFSFQVKDKHVSSFRYYKKHKTQVLADFIAVTGITPSAVPSHYVELMFSRVFLYLKEQDKKRQSALSPEQAKLLADNGDSHAQYIYGLYKLHGLMGVQQDTDGAVKWFRKAILNDNADAMYLLSMCYRNGRGVTKSLQLAEKWRKDAAKKGQALAKNNIVL